MNRREGKREGGIKGEMERVGERTVNRESVREWKKLRIIYI